MAVQRTLICLAATIALLMQLAMAATYTVGGPNDFQYTTNHDVLEVSKADYDSCTSSNAVQSYNGGNTVITLSSPGKRYFICGTAGHCSQGMKLEVDTLASSSPPSATPSAPAPATPSTPPPSSPKTPPPKASPSTPTPVSSSAPETSSPSPAKSPKTAPKMSPTSPSSSPSSSPPLANVPSTESHTTASPPGSSTTASPPGSSSATKGVSKTTVTLGFSLGMLMLLAL